MQRHRHLGLYMRWSWLTPGLQSALPALICTLNSVGCTQIYLWSSYDAMLMYFTGFYVRCNFNLSDFAVFAISFATEIEWWNNWCQILAFLPRNRKFFTVSSLPGPRPLAIMLEHIRGSVVIGDSPIKVYWLHTHSGKMTVSIIVRSAFVFNMNTLPDNERSL